MVEFLLPVIPALLSVVLSILSAYQSRKINKLKETPDIEIRINDQKIKLKSSDKEQIVKLLEKLEADGSGAGN